MRLFKVSMHDDMLGASANWQMVAGDIVDASQFALANFRRLHNGAPDARVVRVEDCGPVTVVK